MYLMVGDAWRRGQAVAVHGWIYGLQDGLLRDLHCTRKSPEDGEEVPGSTALPASSWRPGD